ncbi:MAG: LexA family transcriptional regulator [Fusobacterium sp. JB021]|nr:LexA family transcriptional regulator [Fusobacterium sp. JB021]MDP0506786.1 LexA family transcriptional regulator [Fusobacterium sp. JB019]
MTFVKFLKEKRLKLGLSQNKFSKLINITQSYFNSIERGEVKNPPSEEILEKIADGLNLSKQDKNYLFYLAAIERTPKLIINMMDDLKNKLNSKENNLISSSENFSFHSIPLFERISAGPGAFGNEEIEDYILLPGINNNNNDIFAVNVVGDSMEPTIKDNSVIICKKNMEIKNGEIGAFFIDDQAYVKRLKITQNYIALISDNPNYTPIYIGPGENFHAVGKVIKVLSDI